MLLFIVAAFAAILLLYFAKKFYSSMGPNPFKSNTKLPKSNLETNPSIRQQILARPFDANQLPDQIDAIVIGSGISGLSCAATLARAGKRVVVLEKHHRAGGATHTFHADGYEWDVGLYYCGKMHDGTFEKFALDQMTDGQLEFEPMEKTFDSLIITGDKERPVFDVQNGSSDIFVNSLLKHFPDEREAIEAFTCRGEDWEFFTKGLALIKILPRWIVYALKGMPLICKILVKLRLFPPVIEKLDSAMSTRKKLDTLTKNAALRMILTNGVTGVTPTDMPLFFQQLMLDHYYESASYPLGGASEIAFNIIQKINKLGGSVFVNVDVEQVLFDEENRARGVSVNSSGWEKYEISCDSIVSATGAIPTLTRLVPRKIAEQSPLFPLIERRVIHHGMPVLLAFIGLNRSSEELNLSSRNWWLYEEADIENTHLRNLSMKFDDVLKERIHAMYVTFPSAKDSSFDKRYPGRATCTCVVFLSHDWFDPKTTTSDEREANKSKFGILIQKQLLEQFPQLESAIDCIHLKSTTSDVHMEAIEGAMLGLENDLERHKFQPNVELRADIGLKGLWLSGQDTVAAGLCFCCLAGIVTAGCVLNRLTALDLEILFRRRKGKNDNKKQ